MGKMHLMQLIEINRKTYAKSFNRHYFYKQWHHPTEYNKRIEKVYLVRKHHSNVETSLRTRTTYGERPDFVYDVDEDIEIYLQKNGDLMADYLRRKFFLSSMSPAGSSDILKTWADPVEVLFTDKWFKVLSKEEVKSEYSRIIELLKEIQKNLPTIPYLDTFLEPYLITHPEYIRDHVDELCDADFIINPFAMLGHSKLEEYVINIYKSRKNVIPYKEDLIDCFTSKLNMPSKYDVLVEYKKDKRNVWSYLDGVVRNIRKIEKYLQHNGIEPIYFNLDRDDYKEVFGFEKDGIPRTNTHSSLRKGDYPERKQFEQIAKEYVVMRNMKDMRGGQFI